MARLRNISEHRGTTSRIDRTGQIILARVGSGNAARTGETGVVRSRDKILCQAGRLKQHGDDGPGERVRPNNSSIGGRGLALIREKGATGAPKCFRFCGGADYGLLFVVAAFALRLPLLRSAAFFD
jgi:hypothetical protein